MFAINSFPFILARPKFRSYTPQDEAIKENAIIATTEAVDLEAEVHSQLELLRTPIVIDEIDIANLAPRKPDWDLKRDVSKKLEKLELRTQRSIAELIRVRLRSAEPTNMLEGVNLAGTTASSSKLIRSAANDADSEEATGVET